MTIVILILIFVYIALFVRSMGKIVRHTQLEGEREVRALDILYQQAGIRRDKAYQQKMALENEAFKIFTLYDMTKEVTKSLNEEASFNIFKAKLTEHARFDQCYYFPPYHSLKKKKEDKSYILFNLKSKRKKMGQIVVEGMDEADREILTVLGHQYALALRRVKLYKEIERIAIMDGLTQVHTRRYALERLHEEIKRSKQRNVKMTFLMIDVDHFKRINDKYGHIAGDQVLKEVGVIILESIREIDIAGRYGGEEFCVVLPDTDKDGALYVAERIRAEAEKRDIKAFDVHLHLTLSIGGATYPKDADKLDGIIDKADWCLYKAKKQGRNRVCLLEQ